MLGEIYLIVILNGKPWDVIGPERSRWDCAQLMKKYLPLPPYEKMACVAGDGPAGRWSGK